MNRSRLKQTAKLDQPGQRVSRFDSFREYDPEDDPADHEPVGDICNDRRRNGIPITKAERFRGNA